MPSDDVKSSSRNRAESHRSSPKRPSRTEGVDAVAVPSLETPIRSTPADVGNRVFSEAIAGGLEGFGEVVAGETLYGALGLSSSPERSNTAMNTRLSGQVMRRASRMAPRTPTTSLAQLLASSRGFPIPPAVASRMSGALGVDVSDVVLHTDASAAAAAQSIGALAFTLRRHIFFDAGRYAPGTDAGDELLLHELVHADQYARGLLDSASGDGFTVSQPTDWAEVEATQVSQTAMSQLGAMGSPHTAIDHGLVGVDPVPAESTIHTDGQLMGMFGWVGGIVESGLLAAVRALSPGFAGILENGIGPLVSDLFREALNVFLSKVLNPFDIQGRFAEVNAEIHAFFGTIQGVLEGEPGCCETFQNWLDTVQGFMADLSQEPVVRSLLDMVEGFGGVVDMFREFLGGAPGFFDELLAEASDEWNDLLRLVNIGRNIAGWIWEGICGLIGIDPDQGSIVDWLISEVRSWFSSSMDDEGPSLFSRVMSFGSTVINMTPIGSLLDIFGALKGVWDGAQFLWNNWNSPTLIEDASATSPALGIFAEGLKDAAASADEFGAWVSDYFPTALANINESLNGLGDGWLAYGAKLLLTPMLVPLQLGTDFAIWYAQGGDGVMAKWAADAWEHIEPFTEVLGFLVMLAASATTGIGMIPVIFAGVWRLLPDCQKPAMLDFILDVLTGAVGLLGSIPLVDLLATGLIGLLEAIRGQSDEDKVLITNNLAKILTGSPQFIVGLVSGLGVGMFDGVKDTVSMLWMVLDGVMTLVSGAASLLDTVRDYEAADVGADTGAEAAEELVPTPDLTEYLTNLGERVRPPIASIGQDFTPAFQAIFGGGDEAQVTSIEGLAERMGSMWQSAKEAVAQGGTLIGQKLCEMLVAPDVGYQVGYVAGYVGGVLAVEALIAFLTAGAFVALKAIGGALVRFGTNAFKAFKAFGKLVLERLMPMLQRIGSSPPMRRLMGSLRELADRLIRASDDLMDIVMRGRRRGRAASAPAPRPRTTPGASTPRTAGAAKRGTRGQKRRDRDRDEGPVALRSKAQTASTRAWRKARKRTGKRLVRRAALESIVKKLGGVRGGVRLRLEVVEVRSRWHVKATASRGTKRAIATAGLGWIARSQSGERWYCADDMGPFNEALIDSTFAQLRRSDSDGQDDSLRAAYNEKVKEAKRLERKGQRRLDQKVRGLEMDIKMEPFSGVERDKKIRTKIRIAPNTTEEDADVELNLHKFWKRFKIKTPTSRSKVFEAKSKGLRREENFPSLGTPPMLGKGETLPAFVVNTATTPGEVEGNMASRYFGPAWSGAGQDYEEAAIFRTAVVVGVNKFVAISEDTTRERVEEVNQAISKINTNTNWTYSFFGFLWEPHWYEKGSKRRVAYIRQEYKKAYNAADAKERGELEDGRKAREKVSAKTLPYGDFRNTVMESKPTKKAVNRLSQHYDPVHALLQDADSRIQAQSGSGVLAAYDDILKKMDRHPLVTIGMYRVKGFDWSKKGDPHRLQLTKLGNQLDQAIRKAIAKIAPEILYPTEPNSLVKLTDKTHGDGVLDRKPLQKDLFGHRETEGQVAGRNIRAENRVHSNVHPDPVAYRPDASIEQDTKPGLPDERGLTVSQEQVWAASEGKLKRGDRLLPMEPADRKHPLTAITTQSQTYADPRGLTRETWKADLPPADADEDAEKQDLREIYDQVERLCRVLVDSPSIEKAAGEVERIEEQVRASVAKLTGQYASNQRMAGLIRLAGDVVQSIITSLTAPELQQLWDDLRKTLDDVMAAKP
ncbi:MAG: DUF4157 domain-containing protein [Myxococcota bacterium]